MTEAQQQDKDERAAFKKMMSEVWDELELGYSFATPAAQDIGRFVEAVFDRWKAVPESLAPRGLTPQGPTPRTDSLANASLDPNVNPSSARLVQALNLCAQMESDLGEIMPLYHSCRAQLAQETDIRTDRETMLQALQDALKVPAEPHQTYWERLLEAAGAVSARQQREERRVYKDSAEHADYLKARFMKVPAISFEWQGRRWKYEYTDFDDKGDFDLLIGSATASTTGAFSVPAQYTDAMLERGVAQLTEAMKHPELSKESICGMVYDGMTAAFRSATQERKP